MRAKSSIITSVALCAAVLLPAAGGAQAAEQRRGAKQARPAAASAQSPDRQPAADRGDTLLPRDARLSGNRRGTAIAVSMMRPRPPVTASMSCVPYVRMVTGMQVFGNAHTWWGNAAGSYDRGHRPEPGSVLAFRASGGMVLGHVAVVQRVLSPREIEIEHSNWEGPGIRKGQPLRDVSVIDVSERNDWTAVRVEVGRASGSHGRTYATHGFIHNRPDGAPGQGIVRYASGAHRYEEVAEAPLAPRASFAGRTTLSRPIDLSVGDAATAGSRR